MQSFFIILDWIMWAIWVDHIGKNQLLYTVHVINAALCSPLMLPKQKEMDKVVEDIYDIVSRQDAHRISQNPDAKSTLIVLCGDHGMNEVNGLLFVG